MRGEAELVAVARATVALAGKRDSGQTDPVVDSDREGGQRTAAHDVVRREERTGRIEFRTLVGELPEGFNRQRIGRREGAIDHRHGRHAVLQFRTRRAKRGDIEGLEVVHATGDEDALAPVESLLADAKRRGMAVNVPIAVNEGVEHVDVVFELLLAVALQVAEAQVVPGIDRVVEGGRTHEGAVIAPLGVNVGGDAADRVGDVAPIEVQIAVVGVDTRPTTARRGAAAIDLGHVLAAARAGPHGHAQRDRRVDRDVDVAEFELFGLCRSARHQGERCGSAEKRRFHGAPAHLMGRDSGRSRRYSHFDCFSRLLRVRRRHQPTAPK